MDHEHSLRDDWDETVNNIALLQMQMFGDHGHLPGPKSKAAARRARILAQSVICQMRDLRVQLNEVANPKKELTP
jgi:hypothetical protein